MFLSDTQKAAIAALSPTEILGNIIQNQMGVVVGEYDFARDGGAALAVIPLKDINTGMPISLPVGTLVCKTWIDVQTPCVGAGSIALSTGETAADILAATAAASITGVMAGVSTGTAATMKKITSTAKTPIATLSVGTISAGKFRVYLEFVRSA